MDPYNDALSADDAHLIPDPPSDLSDDAEALWRGHFEEWNDDDLEPDARELAILTEACRHLSLASRLAAELSAMDSVLVPGSRGNERVHPIVSELDKIRRTVGTLLKSIAPAPDRSAVGRANVARRWQR